MSHQSCSACNDLREYAPGFVLNGVTDAVCNNLKNNFGLSHASGHDDCDDLHDVNDCLIGNMDDEIEGFDNCDWKKFMHTYIPNDYETNKAMICAMCGMWASLEKAWCYLNNITQNQSFAVDETHIRWAPGVTKNPDASTDPTLAIPRITGNAYCAYMTGSIILSEQWMEDHDNASLNKRGALLYEYRVKLADFDLKRFYNGNMQENASGKCVHAHIYRFVAGDTTYGNNADDTTGSSVVPDGWEYLQVRMSSYDDLPSTGHMTLSGVLPVLMNPTSFDC